MNKEIDEEVLRFLQSYWDWLQNGAPDVEPYYRDSGLCYNLEHQYQTKFHLSGLLPHGLMAMFIADKLDPNYPFGKESFKESERKGTMHLSRKRRNWVKSKLGIE